MEHREIRQNFWDVRFAQLAKLISLWSKDPSTKCGSVIVRPDRTVASVGFNGFPMGVNDSEELYADRAVKLSIIKHAEENALMFANESVKGYTLYVYPLPPCSKCAGSIIQRGITRVVAIVPPKQLERIMATQSDFNFEASKSMFATVGIDFTMLVEEVDICCDKPKGD